eukprot:3966005-Pleurochrysis_carterae.AAC.3
MAEEWPGATDSAARPSESVADGRKEADLLASASNLALSVRRRMTAAGDSWVCIRAAINSLRRVSSCSGEDRRASVEAREGGT